MKITSRFTVAVHTLLVIHLFGRSAKVTSDFIADSVQVNPVVIRRALVSLKRAGFIEVKAGSGGKAWKYAYKYRRGGKTLCALYARENRIGFLLVFGKDEREKFEADRNSYTKETQAVYDKAQTYHDGKWMMFAPTDTSLFGDFLKLLRIKRKPNKA